MTNFAHRVSSILHLLAQELDISDTAFEAATRRYQSVGTYLARPESILAKYRPRIYAQGSLNLGTVTKPCNDSDHYDIDAVCELDLGKNSISQEDLKKLVGSEIHAYAKANSMLNPVDEGRRCWTLDYAEAARFHMDILPAVPDEASLKFLLESNGLGVADMHQRAIAITDRTHKNYKTIANDWFQSNPQGYAVWFKLRMLIQFNEQRRRLAEARHKQLQEIPEYAVKTTLQRAIQLLKRHRDLMFVNSPDEKPISIIITTLAAQAYNNEPDLAEALFNIITGIPRFIEIRGNHVWIPNPVNPLENFADRWTEQPELNEKFHQWLNQAEQMLLSSSQCRDLKSLNETLADGFGKGIVERASDKIPAGTLYIPGVSLPKLDSARTDSRFQQSHRHLPRWRKNISGDVRITGRIQHGTGWLQFATDSKPVPKRRSLKFKAITNVPAPFEVHWQVVNTGEEARSVGGLRGELTPGGVGSNGLIRDESTLYKGMHWIQCFIVKDGVCVADSAPFVVNIQ